MVRYTQFEVVLILAQWLSGSPCANLLRPAIIRLLSSVLHLTTMSDHQSRTMQQVIVLSKSPISIKANESCSLIFSALSRSAQFWSSYSGYLREIREARSFLGCSADCLLQHSYALHSVVGWKSVRFSGVRSHFSHISLSRHRKGYLQKHNFGESRSHSLYPGTAKVVRSCTPELGTLVYSWHNPLISRRCSVDHPQQDLRDFIDILKSTSSNIRDVADATSTFIIQNAHLVRDLLIPQTRITYELPQLFTKMETTLSVISQHSIDDRIRSVDKVTPVKPIDNS